MADGTADDLALIALRLTATAMELALDYLRNGRQADAKRVLTTASLKARLIIERRGIDP